MLFSKWCLPNPDKFKKDISDTTLPGRILSYSLKITNRSRTMYFFREILGMKILRHNEYSDETNCHETGGGVYGESRWSKTMVGYGPEDKFFALELIYNYPIQYYDKGNALICITIKSSNCLKRAKKNGWPIIESNRLEAPDGFKFQILNEPEPTKTDPIVNIVLAVSKVKRSLKYWHDILGMELIETNIIGYNQSETVIELKQVENPIQHGDCGGRISLSLPDKDQEFLEYKLEKFGYKILVPVVTFENDLLLLLLQDPDGYELCYYNKKGYSKIAVYCPTDEKILNKMLSIEETIEVKDEPAKRVESRKMLESMRRKQVSNQLLKKCETDLLGRYYYKFKNSKLKKKLSFKNIFKDIITPESSENSFSEGNRKKCIKNINSKSKKEISETNLSKNNDEKENNLLEKTIEEKSEDLNKTEDKSVLVMLSSATVIYKKTLQDENMTNTDSKDNLIDLEDKFTETQNEESIDNTIFNNIKLREYRSKSPEPSRTIVPNLNYSQVHRSKSRDYADTWFGNDNHKDNLKLRFDKSNVKISKDVRSYSKPNIQYRTRTLNKNNYSGFDSDRPKTAPEAVKNVKSKNTNETKKSIKTERKETRGKHNENCYGLQKPIQQKNLNKELPAKKDKEKEKHIVKNTKGYSKELYRNTKVQNKTVKINETNLDNYQSQNIPSKFTNSSEEFICLTEMNVDKEEEKMVEDLKNSFKNSENNTNFEFSDNEKQRISDFKVNDLFIFNEDLSGQYKINGDDKFENNERQNERINDYARIKQTAFKLNANEERKETVKRKSVEPALKRNEKENLSAKLKAWIEQGTNKDVPLESPCKMEKYQYGKVKEGNKIIGDVEEIIRKNF